MKKKISKLVNIKVLKNKSGQKKCISSDNTNPTNKTKKKKKKKKQNNNTNRKKKHSNLKRG